MRAWDEVLINVAPVLIDDGAGLFSQKGMKPIGLAKAGVAEAGQLSPELMYYALLCEPDDDAERGRFNPLFLGFTGRRRYLGRNHLLAGLMSAFGRLR